MSALDKLYIPSDIAPFVETEIPTTDSKVKLSSPEKIRELVSKFFWLWYENNHDEVAFRVSLFRGFIRVSIYVHQLEDLFISLFGPKDGVSS